MNIINVPEFNISSFSIGIPNKRHNNGYGSILSYDGYDIIIQTPLCVVENIDMKDKKQLSLSFKLADNFEYFQFFCSLHELIIKHLCRYSENSEYDIMSEYNSDQVEIRKNVYSHISKVNDTEMFMKLQILDKTQFFDRMKTEISGLELKNGDQVVCIIKSNQLSMNEKTSIHSWNCVQCLVWDK